MPWNDKSESTTYREICIEHWRVTLSKRCRFYLRSRVMLAREDFVYVETLSLAPSCSHGTRQDIWLKPFYSIFSFGQTIVQFNIGNWSNTFCTFTAGPSKAAIKQKEKREARKARKADEKAQGDVSPPRPASTAATSKTPFVSTGDPDKDKKIKNINKVIFFYWIWIDWIGIDFLLAIQKNKITNGLFNFHNLQSYFFY